MNEFARITSFVRSMAKEDAGKLGELYRDAIHRGVPVIRPEARELLKTHIQVICGDAADTLKELPDDTFEFAFVYAAKAQYIYYLPDVLRVLKKGGVIVSDNILQEGEVLESHFLVEKRNRTIHDRMREYLHVITHDERLETAILPVGDGMAISVVREA